jgi:hypothetical protein
VRKLVTVVICTLVVAAPAAAVPPLRVPALTRIASKISGLPVRSRPKVVVLGKGAMQRQALGLLDRDYPPDQQAYDETLYRALGLLPDDRSLRPFLVRQASATLGVYDAVGRRIYVRAGSAQPRTLLPELVHALQDQAFGLRRLTRLRAGQRDAALAGAAAADGHAVFAANVRLGIGRRFAGSGPAIDDFLTLEAGFGSATGVRFISTLQNLGGRRAIFTALQQFPTTTEQIFHIDSFLEREPAVPIALPTVIGKFGRAREDSFGELDVRALLAAFAVPRLDRVGAGWGGGRTALYRDPSGWQAVVVALDWDEPTDAEQWAEAVATYVNEAFDVDRPGLPASMPCSATTCWTVGGRDIAFQQAGVRTALVVGPSVADAAAIAQQIASM